MRNRTKPASRIKESEMPDEPPPPHQRRPRRWLSLALVLLLAAPAFWVAGGLTVFAQPREASIRTLDTCRRAALRPQPSWTESAAWSTSGDNLIVVDTLYNKALRYSKAGRSTGTLPEAVESMLARLYPLRIRSENSSFVMELANARFMRLDHNYQPQETLDLQDSVRADGLVATYLFQWAPVARDLLGYGDYKPTDRRDYHSGVLRIPFEEPSRFEVLDLPFSEEDRVTRNLYRLGFPLFSSLGSTGVVVGMFEYPKIYLHEKEEDEDGKVQYRLRALDAFPKVIEKRPVLAHDFLNPSDFPLVMADVEKAAMPTGIFGWRDFLYVLHRRPKDGSTVWSLSKIDPVRDRLLGTSTLHTSANHLTAVPGEKEWAFLEKGPVEAFGKQSVRSVLLVPSEGIEDLGNGKELCSEL
jgi:hypothetical protein